MKPAAVTQPDVQDRTQRLLPGMFEVNVDKPAEVEPALRAATASVTPAAALHGMGILITQIGRGHYIVRVHPQVPKGLVRRR